MREKVFARILKKLRHEKGISQEELSLHAGLHRTYVSQLERELKNPSLKTVSKICDVLEILPSKMMELLEREYYRDETIVIKEKLKKSEAHLEAFVEAMPDLTFVFDENGKYLKIIGSKNNPDYAEAVKQVGKHLSDVFPEEEVRTYLSLIRQTLETGAPQTCEYRRYYSKNQKWFEGKTAPLNDSSSGLKKIIFMTRDITSRKLAETNLRHRTEFGCLVNRLLKRFTAVSPDEIDTEIHRTLAEISKFSGVDQSYIFLFSQDLKTASSTYNWYAPGIEPPGENLKLFSSNNYPWFKEKIRLLEPVYSPCISDLPPEAASEKKLLESLGIRSGIAVPIEYRTRPAGFLAFTCVKNNKHWGGDSFALLKIIGEILISALERCRIAKDLQKSELKYRNLVEGLSDGLIHLKKNGTIAYVNDSLCRMLGYSAKELYAFPTGEITRRLNLNITDNSPGNSSCDIQLPRKNGEKLTVTLSTTTLYDGPGNYHGSLAILNDITKQRKVEKRLQVTREQLQTLIESSEDIVVLQDGEGRYLYFTGPERYGVNTENAIGKTPHAYLEKNVADNIVASVKEVSQTGITIRREQSFKYKDETLWFSDVVFPIRDKDGTITSVATICHNITDRKMVEKEKDRILEELRYRINLEQLINSVSTRFANSQLDDLDVEIKNALAQIGKLVGVDRSYICRLSSDLATVSCTHKWHNSGIEILVDDSKDHPTAPFPWLMENLNRLETIHISSLTDLPPEAENEKKVLLKNQIKSLVSVPLVYRNKLVGNMVFDCVKEKREWSEDIIELLKTVGNIFVCSIERGLIEKTLRENEKRLQKIIKNGAET